MTGQTIEKHNVQCMLRETKTLHIVYGTSLSDGGEIAFHIWPPQSPGRSTDAALESRQESRSSSHMCV